MKHEIADAYPAWIAERVDPALKQLGLELTDPARVFLAGALQAQVLDGLCANQAKCLDHADRLLSAFVSAFRKGVLRIDTVEGRINHNTALHVVTDLNKQLMIFPWAPI